MSSWKINQSSLVEFNSKCVFTIVLDEPRIQSVYTKLKQSANADEVYTEMQEQLRCIYDYAQVKTDEASERTNNRLNLISVVVSVVCSISVIFESIGMFTDWGWVFGFQTVRDGIFAGAILPEVVLFLLVLILVIAANRKPKGKCSKKDRR